MHFPTRLGLGFLAFTLCTAAGPAQQAAPSPSASERMTLDVVVTPKSGAPISGLKQQDFTILDNKKPQTIASFAALGGPQAPIEVVVVVDIINANLTTVTYERAQLDKFLKAEGGRLTYPTSLATFKDDGITMLGDPSQDGNELSSTLDRQDLGLRDEAKFTGASGEADKRQLSRQAARSFCGCRQDGLCFRERT